MNSKIKWVVVVVLILSIVTTIGVYFAIPHPRLEVTEIIHNPNFHNENGQEYTNVTVVVRNHGASGLVNITAIYQISPGFTQDFVETTQTMYIPSGKGGWVQFTMFAGIYDADSVWLIWFSSARVKPA